jgi:ABC-type bacteriocin/lantibiotic exporter with double-glycine peptidase domain
LNRQLGGELGLQANEKNLPTRGMLGVTSILRRVELIRRDIHRAKFFMKSLNNFLTALTPFFFYSLGGYLVINDRLSFGALVAVLAAYKDFSAPLKELFRYYQTSEDVRIRYENMLLFLSQGQSSKSAVNIDRT